MPRCKTDLESKLYEALKRIAAYESPQRLMKSARLAYGIPGEEAVEMAYENVLSEAKSAIRNVRPRES